ncbi:MAG: alpha/beta fold hydrolase [Bacteroidia bacterium]|nr:alpha/beta fold hydrolase [Bacteroidia bacterium]MDW8158280.1 alpha/beta fold hydrolase [Bacteroidia bacterium]
MELWHHRAGKGEIPIVILHGLFGSSDNWRTIANILANNYSVISLDLRNHGRSPHTESHTYLEMAQDLEKFFNSHSFEQVFLIGHSMGGKAAMTYATLFPERVKKLIVVDIAPRAYNPHHNQVIDALFSVPLEQIENRQAAEQHLMHYLNNDATVVQFLMKGLYRKEDGTYAWRFNLPVLAKDYAEITAAIPESGNYPYPTVFIKGSTSDYIQDRDEELIRKIFPRSSIKEVRAGHWVHAEAPQPFLEIVKQFLTSSLT